MLTPYYNTTNLSFVAAQNTLKLTYKKTTLWVERNDTKTSGLDPTAVRPAQAGFPQNPMSDPAIPIASASEPHLTLDVEGVVANADGTWVISLSFAKHQLTNLGLDRFWISDEYGPYIYRFSADGHLVQTIQPPAAILPKDKNGNLIFTSDDDPATGRGANQGMTMMLFHTMLI